MKNLLLSVFVLAVALTSCEHGNPVTPDETAAVSSGSMREAISPTLPKTYQLVKHGASILSYYEDGTLKKVTYGPNVRGSFSTYVLYTHKSNAIVAKLYYNNILAQVITYLLDAGSGNCYESKHVDYIPMGPNAVQEKLSGFTYYYNVKGQIMMRKNKNNVNEYTLFSYDTVGNLVKITNYGYSSYNPGSSIVSESTLSYNQPAGDPLLADLLHINVDQANLPDPYLKIFGKPGKYLVKLVTEKFSLGGKYYTYAMNTDGYPTSRQTYNLAGGAVIETKAYDYLITNIGFSL